MKTYKVTVDNLGNIRWYNEKDQYHREDGPAIESKDGGKCWMINGKFHREDGPAIEYCYGGKSYYLNGKRYFSEAEWKEELDSEEKWKKEWESLECPSQNEINKALEVLGKATGYKITKI